MQTISDRNIASRSVHSYTYIHTENIPENMQMNTNILLYQIQNTCEWK